MFLVLKKIFLGRLSCIPLGQRKVVKEDIQLVQGGRVGPTPTPAANGLELELTEEGARRAELEHEHQRIKAQADAFAEAKGKLEEEIRQVKESLEAREKDLVRKDASLQQLEGDMNEMQTKLAESQTAAERARGLSVRLSELDQLLSERTAELNAAQAFLTRSDAISEAEVVGMIENLNTLISSASGALSATWDQWEPMAGALLEEPGIERVRDYFGEPMVEQIAARNPIAVNLAVQVYLGCFIEQATSGWGGGQATETLAEIYKMISTKEGQSIAARWRTLTKCYAPHQEPPRGEEVVGDLARILMITRAFFDHSEATESVGSNADTEIKAVIEAALQLGDTIKTKIASSDMCVYFVPPGAIFDEERMTDELEAGRTGQEGEKRRVVAGTMEIGLIRRSGNVEKVLRKPTVILEKDLVEPEGENEQ